MKQLCTLFFLLLLSASPLLAQIACMPDTTYQDSLGVFPLPYEEDTRPDGGITESACINKPYEFVFTVAVGGSINFGGVEVPIDSITMETEGAIEGLPTGIDYACNPPDCSFRKDELGCIVLNGTAEASNTPGDYPLEITGNIYSGPLPLTVTFPDPIIASGEYILTLNEENSTECSVVGTEDILAGGIRMEMQPNPVQAFGQVFIEVPTTQFSTFQIHDLLGKVVYHQKVQLFEGENQIPFDASRLSNGIYTYSLNNGKVIASKRMIVSK